jgi:hypothetical protein
LEVRLQAAIQLGELLLDSVRVLGEHHPHTGWARYRLALSERDAGRTDQALEQLAIVHTSMTQIPGMCGNPGEQDQ